MVLGLLWLGVLSRVELPLSRMLTVIFVRAEYPYHDCIISPLVHFAFKTNQHRSRCLRIATARPSGLNHVSRQTVSWHV